MLSSFDNHCWGAAEFNGTSGAAYADVESVAIVFHSKPLVNSGPIEINHLLALIAQAADAPEM